MDRINWRFSDKFGSHWIKVKFYKEKPKLKEVIRLKNVMFCEATKKAIIQPIILDKDSISCLGAQYAFGWEPDKKRLLEICRSKTQASIANLKSMLSRAPRFRKPFKYIGLNTEGIPDLIMAYTSAQEIMNLTRLYQRRTGKNLDVLLPGMMPICGGIAVKTYLEGKITLSFGCVDSRNFADLRREFIAVGIPKDLWNIFID